MNDAMVRRLREIYEARAQATRFDLNFYTHELREFVRYRRLGWPVGQPNDQGDACELWNNTHTASLEDYGLPASGALYHPVLKP